MSTINQIQKYLHKKSLDLQNNTFIIFLFNFYLFTNLFEFIFLFFNGLISMFFANKKFYLFIMFWSSIFYCLGVFLFMIFIHRIGFNIFINFKDKTKNNIFFVLLFWLIFIKFLLSILGFFIYLVITSRYLIK